jgi:glycosyltransferase involved in cell wall biosynthesis
MRLSVIIPAYNEAQFIDELIIRVKAVVLPDGITKEIIVVNDGSTDETAAILKKYTTDSMIKLLSEDKNEGKSVAVKKGIDASTGDIILIQDADLEYDPGNYPVLIEPIINSKASIVYGSRFKGKAKNMAPINRIANIISNHTVNMLYGTKFTDINTGHKIFRREVFDYIKITSDNFTLETELTVKSIRLGYKIHEVPICYIARSKWQKKKMTWFKATQMYMGIITYTLMPD